MAMDEITILFAHYKELPLDVSSRIKERKSKIRKFMLYVNQILNETEKDIQEICHLFSQFEDTLMPNRILNHKSDDSVLEKSTAKNIQMHCKANTDGKDHSGEVKSMLFDNLLALEDDDRANKTRLNATHRHKTTAASSHSRRTKVIGHRKCKLGKPRDLSYKNHDTKVTSECETSDTLGVEVPFDQSMEERMESTFLTPVSSLLNNVLSSVTPTNHSTESKASLYEANDEQYPARSSGGSLAAGDSAPLVEPQSFGEKHSNTVSKLASTSRTNAVDLTASPALLDGKDKDENNREPVDDDITQLPDPGNLDTTDIIVTNHVKKKQVVWPIGYPRPSGKGELLIEPSSTSQKSKKRVRQTRLDGFLAKASYTNIEKGRKRTLITMRRSSERQSVTTSERRMQPQASSTVTEEQIQSVVKEHVDSNSDEELIALNLDLLNTGKTTRQLSGDEEQNSKYITSHRPNSGPALDKKQSSSSFDSLPTKKAKYQPGDVVRGRARKELTGYRCMQCYQYYRTLDLSEEEIQQRLNDVCRHRAVKPPMETPPNYWNMSIVPTLEIENSQCSQEF